MQVFYINFLFPCVHLKTHIPAINGYSGWHLEVIATLANKSWTTNLCHTSWTHQFWFIVFLWEFGSFGPLKKSKLLQHSWYKLCCLTSPFQLVAFIGVLGNNFPANTGCRTLIYTVGKYQCWAVIASLRERDKIRTYKYVASVGSDNRHLWMLWTLQPMKSNIHFRVRHLFNHTCSSALSRFWLKQCLIT